MAVDRTGPPEDEDPERKTPPSDAADRPEDNPFAKSDQDFEASAAEQSHLVEPDLAEHPRRLPGRPSEGVVQDHEASSSKDNKADPEVISEAIGELKNEGHGTDRSRNT
ncbi:hypothetical protein [Microlunatus speluncae]|uniref:hypothetical protein n=1 Tax=Microlunatus speluncae TaxID=2594267 RepID=UPI0012668228|nr:hypothetical protein [Microlunatus speluncae]